MFVSRCFYTVFLKITPRCLKCLHNYFDLTTLVMSLETWSASGSVRDPDVKIKSGILDPDAMIASSFFADDAKIGK
jgi:hypothetical protein